MAILPFCTYGSNFFFEKLLGSPNDSDKVAQNILKEEVSFDKTILQNVLNFISCPFPIILDTVDLDPACPKCC
jgi:hypothetical protein